MITTDFGSNGKNPIEDILKIKSKSMEDFRLNVSIDLTCRAHSSRNDLQFWIRQQLNTKLDSAAPAGFVIIR